jgi:hypothetical protein
MVRSSLYSSRSLTAITFAAWLGAVALLVLISVVG